MQDEKKQGDADNDGGVDNAGIWREMLVRLEVSLERIDRMCSV